MYFYEVPRTLSRKNLSAGGQIHGKNVDFQGLQNLTGLSYAPFRGIMGLSVISLSERRPYEREHH
jgi:hypothetical protein